MGTARVQGYRDVALSALPFRGIAINDATNNTASVQVYASDSGILFVNEYATTATYTLPVVADCIGKVFFFYCNSAVAIKILGGTVAVMDGATTTEQTDADYITSGATIGSWGVIIGDGERYYFITGLGTWTGTT